MNKFHLLLFSVLLFFTACDLIYPSRKLLGKWQCVSWTVGGNAGNYNIQQTQFNFKDNDLYEATINGHAEKGSFYVEGEKLMTTADGSMQIVTMIEKVTPDSLVLNMNREGVAEQMTFLKVSSDQ